MQKHSTFQNMQKELHQGYTLLCWSRNEGYCQQRLLPMEICWAPQKKQKLHAAKL